MNDAFDRIYGASAAEKRARVTILPRLDHDAHVILGDLFNARTASHYAPRVGADDSPRTGEELVPLSTVREVFDAWLDADCPPETRFVFSIGYGFRKDIGAAIRALPQLRAAGYTTSDLWNAWQEEQYMPIVWQLQGIDPEFADALGTM